LYSPGRLTVVFQPSLNVFRDLEIRGIKWGWYGRVGGLFSFWFKGSTSNA
jgi:hypothetical protein